MSVLALTSTACTAGGADPEQEGPATQQQTDPEAREQARALAAALATDPDAGERVVAGELSAEIATRAETVRLGTATATVGDAGGYALVGRDHAVGIVEATDQDGNPVAASIVPQTDWVAETAADLSHRASARTLVALHPSLSSTDPAVMGLALSVIEDLDELDGLADLIAARINAGEDLHVLSTDEEVLAQVLHVADAAIATLEDAPGEDAAETEDGQAVAFIGHSSDDPWGRDEVCDRSEVFAQRADERHELDLLCIADVELTPDTVTIEVTNRSPRWGFLYLDRTANHPVAAFPPAGTLQFGFATLDSYLVTLAQAGETGVRTRARSWVSRLDPVLIDDTGRFIDDLARSVERLRRPNTVRVELAVDELDDAVFTYGWAFPSTCSVFSRDDGIHATRFLAATQTNYQTEVVATTVGVALNGLAGAAGVFSKAISDASTTTRSAVAFAQRVEEVTPVLIQHAGLAGQTVPTLGAPARDGSIDYSPVAGLHTASFRMMSQTAQATLLDDLCAAGSTAGRRDARLSELAVPAAISTGKLAAAQLADPRVVLTTLEWFMLDALTQYVDAYEAVLAAFRGEMDWSGEEFTLWADAAGRALISSSPLGWAVNTAGALAEAGGAWAAGFVDAYRYDGVVLYGVTPPSPVVEPIADTWFRGRHDLSWSHCDPTSMTDGGSVVDIADDGYWAVMQGMPTPVWAGTLDIVGRGDLTGDGHDEVVVVSSCTTGASGDYWTMSVFTPSEDVPRLLTDLDGGFASNRGKGLASEVTVTDQAVVYETFGPDDEEVGNNPHMSPAELPWYHLQVTHTWNGSEFVQQVELLDSTLAY
jgi:hypothetical protein